MRYQINKLTIKHSTKAERRFLEILKGLRIPFRAKAIIDGREVDFLIGNYAVDIDCHDQDGKKNSHLVQHGYIPLHFSNQEVQEYPDKIHNILKEINHEFNKFSRRSV